LLWFLFSGLFVDKNNPSPLRTSLSHSINQNTLNQDIEDNSFIRSIAFCSKACVPYYYSTPPRVSSGTAFKALWCSIRFWF
jgi:hypothetical protein